jgi:hypothetical protein
MLQDIQQLPLQSSALREFHDAGGAVEYVLFQMPPDTERSLAHRYSAVEGLKALLRSPSASIEGVVSEPTTPVLVSLREFVGPYFDWNRSCLVDPWTRNASGAGSRSSHGDFVTAGYADAFFDPPYGLEVSLERASLLFDKINFALFGGLSAQLDIQKWPTDWSSYFESGLEWWGAHCWTVFAPDRSCVCLVAASTTD